MVETLDFITLYTVGTINTPTSELHNTLEVIVGHYTAFLLDTSTVNHKILREYLQMINPTSSF